MTSLQLKSGLVTQSSNFFLKDPVKCEKASSYTSIPQTLQALSQQRNKRQPELEEKQYIYFHLQMSLKL